MFRLVAILVLFVGSIAQTNAKQLSLPITLEHPILSAMMIERVFTAEEQSYVVLNENNGCTPGQNHIN